MSRSIHTMPWAIREAEYKVRIEMTQGIQGPIAKELNRSYRAQTKQLIRDGRYDESRYDEIRGPRKEARWLAF